MYEPNFLSKSFVQNEYIIHEKLTQKITKLCGSSDYSMHVFFVSVVAYVMNPYKEKQVEIATNKYNSDQTIAFKLSIDDSCTLKSLLMDVKKRVLSANGENVSGKYSGNAIYVGLKQLMKQINYEGKIGWIFEKSGNNDIKFTIFCNANQYDPNMVNILYERFIKLADDLIKNAHKCAIEIEQLCDLEKDLLLHKFNSATVIPVEDNIIRLFNQNVKAYPNKNAIINNEGESYTYSQIDEYSNGYAEQLKNNCMISEGDIVGVYLERNIDFLIAILGIWKAKCIYIPLDLNYPSERIIDIASNSRMKAIITDATIKEKISDIVSSFDITFCAHKQLSGEKFDEAIDLETVAYIIYTSGSSGKPKGVMVQHKGMMNHMMAKIEELHMNQDTVIAQTASQCFDISIWQMFSALIVGGIVYVYSDNIIRNPMRFLKHVDEHKIKIVEVVPSYLEVINEVLRNNEITLKNISYLVVTGENLRKQLVTDWFSRYQHITLVNAYGPTEASDDITHYFIDESNYKKDISIGKPIRNMKIYILNESMQMCPIGVKGEICVSGIGVGKGYLNDVEKTKAVFVECPFDKGVMYKTGDIGYWNADGNIIFIGRLDSQVKVNGHRIELPEIENKLNSNEKVHNSVVLVQEDDNKHKFLCAYIETRNEISSDEIVEYLTGRLPKYMVPTQIVFVDRMPLTSNGKIDRKVLQNLYKKDEVRNHKEACTELEKLLIDVVKSVINSENIGVDTNLYQMGVDSIKAMQIAARLQTYGFELDIKKIFSVPILGNLAVELKKSDREISQKKADGKYALSPIQMSFFENVVIDRNHYNQSALLRLKKNDESKIKECIYILMEHHDSLRIIIDQTNRFFEYKDFDETAIDLRIFQCDSQENKEKLLYDFGDKLQRSIDIYEGPLFRVGLFVEPDGEEYLILVIHHLICDGVSWRIFLEDFDALYSNNMSGTIVELPRKTDSYGCWIDSQKKYVLSKEVKQETDTWLKMIKDEASVFCRSNRVTREERVACNYKSIKFCLDQRETEILLRKSMNKWGCEIDDVLLAAFLYAVKKWNGYEKIKIWIEGHGRNQFSDQINVNRTIGWFTSLYPFVLSANAYGFQGTMWDIHCRLKNLQNDGIGYGMLRYFSNIDGLDDTADVNVMFNYLGQFGNDDNYQSFEVMDINMGDIKETMPIGYPISPQSNNLYVLEVIGETINNKLYISLGYNIKEYGEEEIRELGRQYIRMLRAVCDKIEGNNVFPTSPAQQRLYILNKLDADSTKYNMQYGIKILGEIDYKRIQHAIDRLIERHETLRTTFLLDENRNIVQHIHEKASIKVNVIDIDGGDIDSENSKYDYAFHLQELPLMAVNLLRINNSHHIMLLNIHHIVCDAISITILIKDFIEFYKGNEVDEMQCQYREYALEQINLEHTNRMRKQEEFWLNYLKGYVREGDLPIDMVRTNNNSAEGAHYYFSIDNDVVKKLKKIAVDNSTTLANVFLAAYVIFSSAIYASKDIAVGIPVSGRTKVKYENAIGLFINTLLIRIKLDKEIRFTEVLKAVHNDMIDILNNQDYKFENLIDNMTDKRKMGRNPLFDTLFNYIPMSIISDKDMVEIDGVQFIDCQLKDHNSKFDYTLYLYEIEDHFHIDCNYKVSLFEEETIRYLMTQYSLLLQLVAENENEFIRNYQFLNASEVLSIEDTTEKRKSGEVTLQERIRNTTQKYGDKIAVAEAKHCITYKDLYSKACSLAETIISRGYNKRPIAVVIDDAVNFVTAVLGVLFSQNLYVPVDIIEPTERINKIKDDVEIDLFITDSNCSVYSDILSISDNVIDINWIEEAEPNVINENCNMAYVMFTSGSTGIPKGVLQTQENVAFYADGYIDYMKLTCDDNMAFMANLCHDAAVVDIFSALLSGATLYRYDIRYNNNSDFAKWIEERNITVYHSVPTLFRHIFKDEDVNHYSSIRAIVLGGEKVKHSDFEKYCKLFDDDCVFVNLFGSTEASITMIDKYNKNSVISGWDIPIRHIVDGIRISIINLENEETKVYEEGELVYYGKYICRGYLNDEKNEQFIKDQQGNVVGYKTGDIVKILHDGSIRFTGRRDGLNKIRGFRIHTSEIESLVNKIDGVEDSVVLVHGDNLILNYLTAKFVFVDVEEIKEVLMKSLPSYFMPSRFIQHTTWPKTKTGKVDREKLAQMDDDLKQSHIIIEPSTDTEREVWKIWCKLLGNDAISIEDDFFEIGGNSLNAINLEVELADIGIEVDFSDIFVYKTIKSFSRYVDAKGKGTLV